MTKTNDKQKTSCQKYRQWTIHFIHITVLLSLISCHKNLGFQTKTDKKNQIIIQTTDHQGDKNQSSLPLGERCFQDLCGKNDNSFDFKYLIHQAQLGNADSEREFNSVILPRLNKVFELNQKLQSIQKNMILEQSKNASSINLNEIQIRFFLFIEYFLHNGLELNNNQENIKISKQFKEIIHQSRIIKNYIQNANNPEQFYLELHNKTDLTAALQAEIEFSKTLNANAKKDFKDMYNDTSHLFMDLLRAKVKNRQLFENAIKKSMTQHLFNEIVYGQLLEKHNFKIVNVQKVLNEKIDFFQSLNFDNDQSVNNKINHCRMTWNGSYNLNPSDEQILSLKEKSAEVLRGMKSHFVAMYPNINQSLADIQFQFPEKKQNLKNQWITQLQQSETSYQNFIQVYERLSVENKFIFSSLNLNSLLKFNCNDLFSIQPMDQFNPRNKKITLSWIPAIYPQFASALISHEIAHAISDSDQSFSDVQMCLAAKKNTEQYLTEDFADTIASAYLISLNEQDKNEYYACAFASLEDNQSLINKDSKDNHSTSLYRAVQHILNQGKTLPESCSQLIKQEKITGIEKSCHRQLL